MSHDARMPAPRAECYAGQREIVRSPIDQLGLEAWRKYRGVCPVSAYEGGRGDMRR